MTAVLPAVEDFHPNHPVPPEPGDVQSALAELARSLGHPARMALIRRLADSGSLTAGDLVDGSGLAASTVSEHLRILRDAGVVSTTHDGPRIWYRLDRRAVRELVGGLCTIVGCHDVAPVRPTRVVDKGPKVPPAGGPSALTPIVERRNDEDMSDRRTRADHTTGRRTP